MQRITDIEILELGEGRRERSSPWSSTILVLRMTTSDGIVGYGEAPTTLMTLPVYEQMREVARMLKGKDPTEINQNMLELYRNSFYMPVSMETTSAASAFEIAMLDITGKIYGMPVYKMLGGALRKKIRAYANGWYDDCKTPEEFAKKARGIVSKGMTALKFDPFLDAYDTIDKKQIDHASEVVGAVKRAVKKADILLEFHGRFDANSAIKAAQQLEQYSPLFMEEPVHPDEFDGLLRFRSAIKSPVALGERVLNKNLFIGYFTNNAVDVIQPDITNFTGIREAYKVAAMAEPFGIEVAFHNAFGPIQSAATLNVDLAIRNFLIQESFEMSWPDWKRKLVSGYRLEDGHFELAGGPGLGCKVNERILEEYKISGMEPFEDKEPPWVVRGTFK